MNLCDTCSNAVVELVGHTCKKGFSTTKKVSWCIEYQYLYEKTGIKHDQDNTPLNTQIGGDHYKKMGHHQPWEVYKTWMTPEEFKGFMKGTVISYLAREADKGGHQDIEKAAHTLQIYLELVKQED